MKSPGWSASLGLIRRAPRTSERNLSTILSQRFEVWSLDAERRAGGRRATSRMKHTQNKSQVLMKCTHPLMETSPTCWLTRVLTVWRAPCRKGEDVSLTLDWARRNVLGAIVWARLTNGLLIQTRASCPSLPAFYCLTPPLEQEAGLSAGPAAALSFAASLYYMEVKARSLK